MPRPALTEEQRREIRRRIRRAASELYGTSGLGEISARAIAKKAGVSVGTIYSHFGNLAELMQSLWRQPVRQLVADLDEIAKDVEQPLTTLRALLNKYAEFAQTNNAVYRGAFMFVRPESHPKPEAIAIEEAAIPGALISVIKAGQDAGEIKAGDPIELAQLVWAGVHGAIALPDNLDRVAFSNPEVIVEQMIETLIESISAGG